MRSPRSISILLVSLAVGLSGCGGDDGDDATATGSAATPTAITPAPPASTSTTETATGTGSAPAVTPPAAGETVTVAQYAKLARQACSTAWAAVGKKTQAIVRDAAKSRNADAAASLTKKMVAITVSTLRRELDKIRSYPTPAGEEAHAKRALDAIEGAFGIYTDLTVAITSQKPERLKALTARSEKLRKTVEREGSKLGLKSCIEPDVASTFTPSR